MAEEKDEMLAVCRKIAASLIRLKRQMRELADDVAQTRERVAGIEKAMKEVRRK